MISIILKKHQMLCKDCRKKEIEPTFSEKLALLFIQRIFPETYCDIKADSFTQGFSDGYQEGFKRSSELSQKAIDFYAQNTRENKK